MAMNADIEILVKLTSKVDVLSSAYTAAALQFIQA